MATVLGPVACNSDGVPTWMWLSSLGPTAPMYMFSDCTLLCVSIGLGDDRRIVHVDRKHAAPTNLGDDVVLANCTDTRCVF